MTAAAIAAVCGDCEHAPCICPHEPDADIAWLPALADHDHLVEDRSA